MIQGEDDQSEGEELLAHNCSLRRQADGDESVTVVTGTCGVAKEQAISALPVRWLNEI